MNQVVVVVVAEHVGYNVKLPYIIFNTIFCCFFFIIGLKEMFLLFVWEKQHKKSHESSTHHFSHQSHTADCFLQKFTHPLCVIYAAMRWQLHYPQPKSTKPPPSHPLLYIKRARHKWESVCVWVCVWGKITCGATAAAARGVSQTVFLRIIFPCYCCLVCPRSIKFLLYLYVLCTTPLYTHT